VSRAYPRDSKSGSNDARPVHHSPSMNSTS
jgi:hypothetical protein